MSRERLARLDAVVERYVQSGSIANAVTLVARRGKIVHYAAHGHLDPVGQTPMPRDALFSMASSSKPVTAVAVLTLVEEGLVRLDDPVSRFIPEFAGQQVAMPKPGQAPPPPLGFGATSTDPKPEADLVAATRALTVRDLLTHTGGLMSTGLGNRLAIDIARKEGDTLATLVPQFGKAPLDFQPGTRWSYSAVAAFETLSRIVEIASGKPFDQFLQERIFGPLDMRDTSFVVPESSRNRMDQLYRRTPQGSWTVAPNAFTLSSSTYKSGAVGLYSTARDWARFEQMLLNEGQLNGRRVLAPRTVELMRTDHVSPLYRGIRGTEDGVGFGLSVAIVLDEAKARLRRSKGSAAWEGGFGTMTWNDPREQIVGVLMVQQSVPQLQQDVTIAVMQAITDSNEVD